MRLHAGRESGNSYKVRILLALLGVDYETVIVDLGRHEHKSEAFRALNPRGQVPVLEDGDTLLWDSAACLVYLARKYGRDDLLPTEPAALAEVVQWLTLAGSELQFGLQYARRGVIRGRWIAGDLEQLQAIGRLGLEALEQRLAGHDWLAGERPTIADIACFPYVETAPEAKLPLDPYPGILAWLGRCRSLPGWPGR
jgi:glutathione S-transferase